MGQIDELRIEQTEPVFSLWYEGVWMEEGTHVFHFRLPGPQYTNTQKLSQPKKGTREPKRNGIAILLTHTLFFSWLVCGKTSITVAITEVRMC